MTTIRLANTGETGILAAENGTVAVVRLALGFDADMTMQYGPSITVGVETVQVEHTDETGTYRIPLSEAVVLGMVTE